MLFLFKHLITALKGRVIETEGDADREIFHPLVYSPNETGYVQSQEPGAAAGSPTLVEGAFLCVRRPQAEGRRK